MISNCLQSTDRLSTRSISAATELILWSDQNLDPLYDARRSATAIARERAKMGTKRMGTRQPCGVLITTSQQTPRFVARTGTRLVAVVPTMPKAKRSWI